LNETSTLRERVAELEQQLLDRRQDLDQDGDGARLSRFLQAGAQTPALADRDTRAVVGPNWTDYRPHDVRVERRRQVRS